MSDLQTLQLDSTGNEVNTAAAKVSTASNNGSFGIQYNLDSGKTFSSNTAEGNAVAVDEGGSYMAGSQANDGKESVVASAQTGVFTSDELSAPALKAGTKEGDNARVTIGNTQTNMKTAMNLGYVKVNEFGFYVDADQSAAEVSEQLTKEEDISEQYEAVALDDTSTEAMSLLEASFSQEQQDSILSSVIRLQTGDLESLDAESLVNSLGGEISGITPEQMDNVIGTAYMGFVAQANDQLQAAGVVNEDQDAFRIWAATQHKAEFSNAMRIHAATRDPAKAWSGLIGKYTAGAGSAGIKNGAAEQFNDSKAGGTVVVNGMEMSRKMAIQMNLIK